LIFKEYFKIRGLAIHKPSFLAFIATNDKRQTIKTPERVEV
jgi:hypothetical protein